MTITDVQYFTAQYDAVQATVTRLTTTQVQAQQQVDLMTSQLADAQDQLDYLTDKLNGLGVDPLNIQQL